MEKLVFTSSLETHQIRLYTKLSEASNINFDDVLIPEMVDSQFVFTFPANNYRSFRIYFGRKTENEKIHNIKLYSGGQYEPLALSDLRTDNLWIKSNLADPEIVFSGEPNGFFELKKEKFTQIELLLSEAVICILGLIIGIFIFGIKESFKMLITPFSWSGILVSVFVLSIFLPHPVFNVAFILSFAFIIKDFDYKQLFNNRINVLFILYFIIFICYNLFYTDSFNSSLFETMLPVILLPIYFACAPNQNYHRLFPLSAIVLGIYFTSTSIIDTTIHENINYLSFYSFTKYMHPIYYSYLLCFSLVYLELTNYEGYSKKIFLPALFFLLLCSGSKLIIVLTVIFFILKYAEKKLHYVFVFMLLAVFTIMIFSPTKKRFQEIFNISNLSILNEDPLINVNDQRLNGLTLRLIMWQETLGALSSPKEILFGRGVDRKADEILRERFSERGLQSNLTKYDPHNQLITTYYKMGIPGLLIILGICIYSFYISFKNSNKLLFYTVILFLTAMMSESLLQRVLGIYFFITLFILLSSFTYKSKTVS